MNRNAEKIENLTKPSYLYNERSENVGFQEFGDLSDRIAAIANVFPVFFFFIAALITFTTMTRMVEENRREIGTLKALGYTKVEIAKILPDVSPTTIEAVLGEMVRAERIERIGPMRDSKYIRK